jgi:hypothetical protein
MHDKNQFHRLLALHEKGVGALRHRPKSSHIQHQVFSAAQLPTHRPTESSNIYNVEDFVQRKLGISPKSLAKKKAGVLSQEFQSTTGGHRHLRTLSGGVGDGGGVVNFDSGNPNNTRSQLFSKIADQQQVAQSAVPEEGAPNYYYPKVSILQNSNYNDSVMTNTQNNQ